MDVEAFFGQVALQLASQLPLVVFRKPNQETIMALLQQNNEVFFTKDFTDTGFVFSPFEGVDSTIFIPQSHASFLITDSSSINYSDAHNAGGIAVSSEEKARHIQLVNKGIEHIKKGPCTKVVLSRKEAISSSKEPIDILKTLLNTYPTAFVYLWFHPKVGMWLGATPETLLKVENNMLSTMALAGTQAYQGTLDVVWNAKEKDEQEIVTKFIMSSLQPLVDTLNVSGTETTRAGNLLHLKTDISAKTQSKFNLKQVLKALHPTPAICGYPRQEAKQFILSNEGYDRMFYTGFLGYIDEDNNSEFFVNLRCMELQGNKALLYVGGGITKDSIPENEWEETVAKTKVMKSCL